MNVHSVIKETIIIKWDDDEQCYFVRAPELPGCMTHGETLYEAILMIRDCIDAWKQARAEQIPLPKSEMKQVLITRMDIGMSKGKENAQISHASMIPVIDFPDSEYVKAWISDSFTKVSVKAQTEEEIRQILEAAEHEGLLNGVVVDKGLTQFKGIPTLTAAYVGPGPVELVDKVCGHLKLR